VVLMARTAHLGLFGAPSHRDAAIAEDAMEALGVSHLARARYTEISGGERQLVLIARAVAQQSEFLVMDEPTANLDFGNQVRVLRKVKELAGRKLGLLMTTHFPDHAFLCASQVAVLKAGKLLAIGRPEDVLTKQRLQSAYGVPLRIAEVDAGMRVCVPEMS
jgi:iron complex transport system ATP-binding protein